MLIVVARGAVSSSQMQVVSGYCTRIDSSVYIARGVEADYQLLLEGIERSRERSGQWGILMVWFVRDQNQFRREVLGHDYWVHDDFTSLTEGVLV